MLQSFSDRLRNSRWLGYAIVGAISLPFVLWGIGSYVSGPGGDTVVEVNGQDIQSYQLEQLVSQRRRMLTQRFGGKLPSAFSEKMLREQALNELITRELLRQTAQDAGFRVDKRSLAARIRQQKYFRKNGSFDRDLYQQTLKQAGMTPAQYEAQVQQGYVLEQLREGVAKTAFVLPGEARYAARLRAQERHVSVLERDRGSVAEGISIDDKDVHQYYEAHKDQFETPEQVRIAYLDLDLDVLSQQVDVSEQDVRAEYQSNQDRYRQQVARKAAHILIKVAPDASDEQQQKALAEARDVRRKIAQGADFAAMAKKYSDDAGSADQGGDLGYVTRDTMVKPFEQALFDLGKPGDVSDPVRTKYGYHIIKLLDIRKPKLESFAQARDEIEHQLRVKKAERLFYNRVEVLRNKAYENPGSLEPAAKATGLQLQQSDWFSRDQGQGLADGKKVREAAFSRGVLGDRRNSDPVELGKHHVAVIRVIDHRDPQPRPFDQVRDVVRKKLRARKVMDALHAWSDVLVKRLAEGAVPGDLADDGTKFVDAGWVSQDSDKLDPQVLRKAFGLAPPHDVDRTYTATDTSDGDRAVVVLSGVRLPDVGDDAVKDVRGKLQQSVAQAELEAWIGALRSAADIQRNEKRIERQD